LSSSSTHSPQANPSQAAEPGVKKPNRARRIVNSTGSIKRNSKVEWAWFVLLGVLIFAGFLLYLLSPILAPFVTAMVMAYILSPLVDWLEKKRIPRTIGTILAILFLIGLAVVFILVLVPLFVAESKQLSQQFPSFVESLKTNVLPWVKQHFGVDVPLDIPTIKAWITDALKEGGAGDMAGKVGASVFAKIGVGGLAIIGFLVNLLLIPVVMFYVLRDWPALVAKVDHAIPRRFHNAVAGFAKQVDDVLAEFLRGQVSVMVVMAIFYSAGLWLVGLQFWLPVGMMTGLLVFVPYLGSVSGILLGTIAAFIQFQSLAGVWPVWAVFAVGQTLEGLAVTPFLVGDRIGLHPVAVIFALLAFGQLFGFVGVLVALPLSAVLLVAIRNANNVYQASEIYRKG
jgi:predicted PurR-regulated permease PerM